MLITVYGRFKMVYCDGTVHSVQNQYKELMHDILYTTRWLEFIKNLNIWFVTWAKLHITSQVRLELMSPYL